MLKKKDVSIIISFYSLELYTLALHLAAFGVAIRLLT